MIDGSSQDELVDRCPVEPGDEREVFGERAISLLTPPAQTAGIEALGVEEILHSDGDPEERRTPRRIGKSSQQLRGLGVEAITAGGLGQQRLNGPIHRVDAIAERVDQLRQ